MSNDMVPQKGERVVDGIKYLNMTRSANYLGYSSQGWREYRNRLFKEGKLELWTWEGKAVFAKEEDLKKLKYPRKVTLDELENSED